MITRRGLLFALGAGTFPLSLAAFGQQQPKIYRLGLLSSESPASFADRIEALRRGLRDAGYVEGRNIVIESRWADGKIDRLGSDRRTLTGTWVCGAVKEDFKLTRDRDYSR